jgi:hypothetical protein
VLKELPDLIGDVFSSNTHALGWQMHPAFEVCGSITELSEDRTSPDHTDMQAGTGELAV